MTLQWIDSHCHIDAPDFDSDREAMLTRSHQAGVRELIVVGTGPNLEAAESTVKFAEAYEHVHATVGVHPHQASGLDDSWWPQLCELAARPDVVAIGETGLDNHYDSSTPQEQEKQFIRHLELARDLGKPVICHIRDAHDKAAQILKQYAAGQVQTIIHCFTGTPKEVKRYVDMDFFISYSGIVSFKGKSADPVRQSIAHVPRENLLIETDCPYLAPVPFRGKRNEPAYLVETAQHVANHSGLELAELAEITVENTRRVFTLTSR